MKVLESKSYSKIHGYKIFGDKKGVKVGLNSGSYSQGLRLTGGTHTFYSLHYAAKSLSAFERRVQSGAKISSYTPNSAKIFPVDRTIEILAIDAKDFSERIQKSKLSEAFSNIELGAAEKALVAEMLPAADIDLQIPFSQASSDDNATCSYHFVLCDSDAAEPSVTDARSSNGFMPLVEQVQSYLSQREEGVSGPDIDGKVIWLFKIKDVARPTPLSKEELRTGLIEEVKLSLTGLELDAVERANEIMAQVAALAPTNATIKTESYFVKKSGSHFKWDDARVHGRLIDAANQSFEFKDDDAKPWDIKKVKGQAQGMTVGIVLMTDLKSLISGTEKLYAEFERSDLPVREEVIGEFMSDLPEIKDVLEPILALSEEKQGFWTSALPAGKKFNIASLDDIKRVDSVEALIRDFDPEALEDANISFVEPNISNNAVPSEEVTDAVKTSLRRKLEAKQVGYSTLSALKPTKFSKFKAHLLMFLVSKILKIINGIVFLVLARLTYLPVFIILLFLPKGRFTVIFFGV